jgi:hypothetical protein
MLAAAFRQPHTGTAESAKQRIEVGASGSLVTSARQEIPMRLLRSAGFVWLVLMMTVGPALATTYTWPLQITQPISVNNLSLMPGPGAMNLFYLACSIVVGGQTSAANVTVPTVAGVFAQSGNIVTCGLHQKVGLLITSTVGSATSLTLP